MLVQPLVVLLIGAIVASFVAVRFLFARGRPVARRSGFNCCEFCAAPLRRHAEQSWRYDGTCARCGRVQTWETHGARIG